MNPTAGQGRGLQAGAVAAARLRAAGVQVDELAGKDADDLRGQVAHALRATPDPVPGMHGPVAALDALVVVGGDGMVHLGVNAVAGTRVPLGIIAAGTGNDVARALGLPLRDAEAGADTVLRGLTDPQHRRPIDAVRVTPGAADQGRVGGVADLLSSDDPAPGSSADTRLGANPRLSPANRWFAGVLCAGFDAVVNERANGWTWPRGRAKYLLAMLRELPVFTPRRYTIDLDGQQLDTAAMLVAVANGPSYGGGMRVAPGARLDDGRLDVMVVAPLSRARFLAIFPRVYAGTHVSDPRVSVTTGGRVVLAAEGIVAYADGERIGPLPLTCEVVPGALVVLAGRAGETSAG